MSRKILIVDDDQKTRVLLKTYLEKNQFEVVLAHNGESFIHEFQQQLPQLAMVILDVMLPDTDGFALCKLVRQRSNLPIIMLTASSDDTDRIVGLELGADDYIAKPYNPRELLARIKAILRRTGMAVEATGSLRYYRFLGFTMDIVERKVTTEDGNCIALTGLDYQLLKYFVEHPGDILDRHILAEETRGRDSGPFDRSLDVQISRLRTLLNDDSKQPSLIKTVRGAGYVFAAEVSGGVN